MVSKAHVCFAASEALTQEEAQFFGNEIAEVPIINDYVTVTEGSFFDPTERDWWDEGPLSTRNARYQAILVKRHRLNKEKKKRFWNTSIPDILTYQGLNRQQLLTAQAFRIIKSKISPLLRFAPGGKGNRHEYYEIKPRNANNVYKGTVKIRSIDPLYRKEGLPYVGGTVYPDALHPGGIARLSLVAPSQRLLRQWQRAVRVASRQNGLLRIDIYLEVSRRSLTTAPIPDGLLLYRICVEITSEEFKNDSKLISIARNLVHAWTMCATEHQPELIRTAVKQAWQSFRPVVISRDGQPEKVVPDNQSYAPPRFPIINITFTEIWPKLEPARSAVREAMISRGIGLPGDEYLVCCNDTFFATLAADAVPLLNLMRTIHATPLRWYGYVKDRGPLGFADVVVETQQFIFEAGQLALDAFADFRNWAGENPGKAAVLVVVVLIVAAATIYFAAPAIAAELGLGIAAEVGTEAAVGTGARIAVTEAASGQALRIGMGQQLMQDALIEEMALQQTGRQAAQQTARVIAQTNGVPSSVEAAMASRNALLAQAANATGRMATETMLNKTGPMIVAGAIGTTIAASGRVAYAQVKGAVAPTPEGKAIGLQVGQMFLVKADKAPPLPTWLKHIPRPELIPPQIGRVFDAARFSKEAADTLKPGGPKEVKCIYLGRLKVT